MSKQSDPLLHIEPFIPCPTRPNQEMLNPEFAYVLWTVSGTLARAAQYLKEHGITSYTDKPYTRQGVHLAAMASPQYVNAKRDLAKRRRERVTHSVNK